MKMIEERISWAQKENARARKHNEEFTKKLEEMKATIKAAIEAEPRDGAAGFDGDLLEDKRRKQYAFASPIVCIFAH